MKRFTVIILTLALALPAFSQGRFGKDSAECVKYLSYYSELVKQKNLDEAAPFWRQAISLCPPTAQQTMFTNGQSIIRNEIRKNAKDAKRVAELVDTLMMLHETRAEYYPSYFAKSLDNKAIDAISYFGSSSAKVYEITGDVLNRITKEASPVVYVKFMQSSVDEFKAGKIDAEKVMNDYTNVSNYIEEKLSAGANPELASAKQDVETILIESGVASCENLVALYTPRYEANPTDKALLSSMVMMLSKSECLNTELFLKSVESLHSVDPSASSAYYLYRLYSSRDENEKAVESLENAISLLTEEEVATKAEYKLELATFLFKKLSRGASAVTTAKEAIELDQSLAGKAYLLIGTIWGSQKCGGNEVESRAAFWVAVDYMTKARNADESLAEEANSLAAQYRKYFPVQADAFMYDMIDGESYTVSCNGMRESTTVRTTK